MSRSLFSLFRVRFTFYERAICSFHRKLKVGLNNIYQNFWLCFHKKEWFTLHHSSRSLQKERKSDALFCQKTSNSHTKNNERIPNHGQNPKLGILLSPDPGDFSKTLPANRNGKYRTNFLRFLYVYTVLTFSGIFNILVLHTVCMNLNLKNSLIKTYFNSFVMPFYSIFGRLLAALTISEKMPLTLFTPPSCQINLIKKYQKEYSA